MQEGIAGSHDRSSYTDAAVLSVIPDGTFFRPELDHYLNKLPFVDHIKELVDLSESLSKLEALSTLFITY